MFTDGENEKKRLRDAVSPSPLKSKSVNIPINN